MKYLIAVAVLAAGLFFLATPSSATTTFANGTAGTDNSGAAYTPVVGTSTTETEVAPTSATAGHLLNLGLTKSGLSQRQEIVVTVKAHIIINNAADAGYYDSTDASAGYSLNTFGSYAKLLCYVLDDANGNTAWTRYVGGDKTLAVGDSSATFNIKVADLPRVKRVAFVPYRLNVPSKVTYSER